MAYNLPAYTTKRFSFGPGILYIGAPGSTPLVDVGAVKGDAKLDIKRTLLDIYQGSPQTLVQRYAIKEDVMLSVTGIEWNLTNLAYALGAGVTTQSGATEQLDFGGDMAMTSRAVRYLHLQPDGSTIDIQLFATNGKGEVNVAIKEKDTHEIAYEFSCIEGSVDFQNVAVAANKKKFRILRTQA